MTKHIRVTVANRDRAVDEKGKPIPAIAIETASGLVEVKPSSSANLVLTKEQFDDLHAVQKRAVQREPGILRLVDFWTEDAAGVRSEYKG